MKKMQLFVWLDFMATGIYPMNRFNGDGDSNKQ